MGALVQKDFLSPVRADVDADLVRHRPGRRVQGCLLAEQARHVLLETVYRRVLPEHVVPDRRLKHRPAHSFRRTGHGVAAKIYHALPPSLCEAISSTRRVVAKWVLAPPASPSSPNSSTTRLPASTTCVAPSGSRNPT